MTADTYLNDLAAWLSIEWSQEQTQQLEQLEKWLAEEAIPAGGLGPNEIGRIRDRHITDSLVFVKLMDPSATNIVDIGSGVGLPAIPIAIARPQTLVTIVDKAGRRTRLASRACRVLSLDNVDVVKENARSLTQTFGSVTFRGSLPPLQAADVFKRIGTEDAEGLVALSRRGLPNDTLVPPKGITFTVECEDNEVLDSPAWMLRMRRAHS